MSRVRLTCRLTFSLSTTGPQTYSPWKPCCPASGLNLLKANSGAEALRYLPRHDFAVVLMDVQMPDLDGFETARLIREREHSGHTPIIFLTAYESDRLALEKAYALGAVDFLVKPLVSVILKAKVALRAGRPC